MLRRVAAVCLLALTAVGLTTLPASASVPATSMWTVDKAWNTTSLAAYSASSVTYRTSPAGGLFWSSPNATMLAAPPTGQAFVAGTSFPAGTTQSASQGVLSFGNNCGVGVLGTVSVQAVGTDGSGTVTSLTASYEAACSNNAAGRYAGVLRFNSTDGYVETTSTVTGSLTTGVGMPKTATAHVTNAGTDATTMGTAAVTGTYAADYAIATDGCDGATLAAGDSCDVTVTFTPTALGSRPATVNVPATGHPRADGAVAFLSGLAVSAPEPPTGLTSYPSLGGVGTRWTPANTGPGATSFAVYRRPDAGSAWTKVGDAPYHFPAVSFVDTSVGAGATVQYAVAGIGDGGEGAKTTAIDVTRAATDPTVGATDAIVVDPQAGLTPERFDAANAGDTVGAALGNPQTAAVVTGTSGTGPSTASAGMTVPFVGPGTYQVVTANPTASQVTMRVTSQNSACDVAGTLTVTEAAFDAALAPQVLAASFAGTCGSNPVWAQVRWHSTQPYVDAVTDVTQIPLAEPVGTNTDTVVTLTSVGTSAVTGGTPTVDGTAAADWTVQSSTCPSAALATGETCTTTVRFTPSTTGNRNAVLHLPDGTPRGERRVALTGVGGSAPDAVTDLHATGTLAGIALSWIPGSANGLSLTGFAVYRSVGADTPALVGTAGPTEHLLVDGTAVPGVAYHYFVAGVNAAGEGPQTEIDGTRTRAEVVYVGSMNYGPSGLYATAPNGGTAVPLEVDGHDHGTPAFSPDGLNIVYSRADDAGSYDLWIRPSDGSGSPRRLTSLTGDEIEPAWSPDGLTIAFTRSSGGAHSVYAVPSAGGTPVARGTNISAASWLPDSATLIVEDDSSATAPLARLAANGTRTAITGTGSGAMPSVSPDGRSVAFVRDDGPNHELTVNVLSVGGGTTPVKWVQSYVDFWGPKWRADGKALYVETSYWSASNTFAASMSFNGTALGAPQSISQNLYGFSEFEPAFGQVGAQFTSAPALTTGTPHMSFSAQPGTTFTCSLDNATATACTSPWTKSGVTSGVHTLAVTASTPGELPNVVAHTFTVDAVLPTAHVGAMAVASVATFLTPSFTGFDSGSGILDYDLRYRRASSSATYGAFTYPSAWQHTTLHNLSIGMTSAGYEYCFSVRAHDKAGNTGAWSAEVCVSRAMDDRSLSASSGWTRATGTGFYSSTYTSTARSGVALSRGSVATRRIVLVATRCATCGSVAVYIGGTYVGTVSLAASTTLRQSLVQLPILASLHTGTVVLKTTSAKTVQIDGIAFRRV